MPNFISKVGAFFRLIDDNGVLSLTNLTVYITMYKLLSTSTPDYTAIAALIAALATYTAKKVINS